MQHRIKVVWRCAFMSVAVLQSQLAHACAAIECGGALGHVSLFQAPLLDCRCA
jgi:hypothetical protein